MSGEIKKMGNSFRGRDASVELKFRQKELEDGKEGKRKRAKDVVRISKR